MKLLNGFLIKLFFSFLLSLSIISITNAQSSQQYEEKLRAEEQQLLSEINLLSKEVQNLDGQKKTIEQAIKLIDAQIKEAQAKIRLKNITIEKLSSDIGVKAQSINDLQNRLERTKESLTTLIKKTNENDNVSLVEIMLSSKAMSDFFINIDSFNSIKNSLNELAIDVKDFKSQTEEEKSNLEDRRAKEADARKEIEEEKRNVEKKKKEQAELLSIKKGQITTYQQWVNQKQARVSQIRSALFELRGTEGIAFGDAYDYAVEAYNQTGVRPAFILAILTQESDLGKNVGSCLLTNTMTGDGKGKNSGNPFEKVMASPRDTTPFMNIVNRLGREWSSTPVSCPPGSKYYKGRGFGGGMGPSQFIPSTWELFKKRIGEAVGVNGEKADPWNPYHAIMATAIYLKDLGANKGGYTAERNAACRYYSGATCTPGRKPANTFYGDQVVAKATNIQLNMINPILGK